MKKSLFLLLAAACAGGTAIAEENGALLDMLVRKKVLSPQEAENVRSEMVKEEASSTAGKIKLSDSITELKVGGDLRLRYQYDNTDTQTPPSPGQTNYPNNTQRSQWRFRLRLNADFKLGPNWFGGVQLSTNQASDSGNQTFTGGFGKYSIYISKAYLGWKPSDWFTAVGGKQTNPFYTTDLVWDPDINPDGFTQQIKFHELFAGSSDNGGGFSKDGKSVGAPAIRETLPWELTLNLGELVYNTNNADAKDNDAADNAYIIETQLVGSYKLSNGVKITFAPAAMFFNAADLSGLNNQVQFSSATVNGQPVSGETRKQTILTAPGDVSWKMGTLPVKLYWDFAYNLQGKGRMSDIYGLTNAKKNSDGTPEPLHCTKDDMAYLVGMQFGQNKKAGDWSFKADWRQTGLCSVDPNLNDSDFALGQLDTRGVRAAILWNVTDAFTLGASYNYAWNLRDHLDSPISNANVVEVVQVDASLAF
jgi:hypothetical protein